jgi:uncharacterized protein YjbI with pentapeptide repeats
MSRGRRPPRARPAPALQAARTRPDVEAAMTIIGRRNARNDKLPIDISRAELIWVYLPGANLERLDLYGADLPRAILRGARLANASLGHANLSDANLDGANLNDADLTGAKLSLHAVPPPGWAQAPSTGLVHRTPLT